MICLAYNRKDQIIKFINDCFVRTQSFTLSSPQNENDNGPVGKIIDFEDEAAIRDVKEVQRKEIARDLLELHELSVRAHNFTLDSSV
jgi:hypothetical protein